MKYNRESSQNSNHPEPNSQLRSQFELLSAYLDGEVSAAERRQVQQWLESDAKIQRLHHRLVKLRHTMRSLPVPAALTPVEETIERVFMRLNRSRWRRWGFASAAAIAAMVAGLGISSLNQSSVTQIAKSNQSEVATAPEALMVALNKPPIEIPKPAVLIQESGAKERKSAVESHQF